MDQNSDIDTLSAADLECLEELRAVGMTIAEGIGRYTKGNASPAEEKAFKGCDVALAFSRVARAVRQIIVLEQEVMGLREKHWLKEKPAPKEVAAERPDPVEPLDRPERRERFDDYNDYDDYFKGTPAEIIAQVRAELMALPGAALVMAAREPAPEATTAIVPEADGNVLLAERPIERPIERPRDRTPPRIGHDPP